MYVYLILALVYVIVLKKIEPWEIIAFLSSTSTSLSLILLKFRISFELGKECKALYYLSL